MIKIFKKLEDIKSYRTSLTGSVGLVPTMGNLHAGHISLVEESLKNNDSTIVTIFVNPKQFGPNEDFDSYPRTLEQDVEKITTAFEAFKNFNKEVVVFAPESNDEIYPEGFNSKISVAGLTDKLCGASRPGHFDGVTTVVYRLFAISKATQAYFGQKDYQQFLVINKMVKDLDYPIQLNMVAIARNADGLALSSRNQYLQGEEINTALTLPTTLVKVSNLLKEKSWVNSQVELNSIIENTISDERWEYLEILDGDSLTEITTDSTKAIILGAFKVGKTRLIDNQLVDLNYA